MNKKLIKNLTIVITLMSPVLVLAQNVVPGTPVTSIYDITGLLNTVINWIFAIFLLVAVIFILMAAFTYLGSAGDPEQVKSAQNKLIYAVVAIAVALIAKGVVYFVQNFLATKSGY